MKKPNSPCFRCEKRNPGCHAECEDYKAFQEANEAYSGVINDEKTKRQLSMTAVARCKERWHRALKNGSAK